MNTVEMAHGSGGLVMQQLINRLFMEAFDNPGSPSRKTRPALTSLPHRPGRQAGLLHRQLCD